MPEANPGEHQKEPTFEERYAAYDATQERDMEAQAAIAQISGDPNYDTSEAVEELFRDGHFDESYALAVAEYAQQYGEDRAAEAAPHFDAMRRHHKEMLAIEAELLPVAAARFAEKAASILHTVDWDALVEHVTANHSNLDVALVMQYICKPEIYQQDLDSTMWAMSEMDRVHSDLAAEGFVKTEAEDTPNNEAYLGSGNLAGAVKDWIAQTESAMNYVSTQRRIALKDALPRTELTRVSRLAEEAGLDGTNQAVVPGEIADALERAAARRMTAFDNYDVALVKQRHLERPNLTLITGGERIARTADIQDSQAFFYELFHEWPHWLSRGIGTINIVRDLPPDQPHIHDDPEASASSGRTTNGDWHQSQNTLRINAQEPYYENMLAEGYKYGHDEAFVRQVICKDRETQLRHTTVHELMHNAHGNVLPIRWLREWDATISGDTVNVTEYVEHMRGKEEDGAGMVQTKREDLCESTALYRYQPARLMFSSAARFVRIQELFGGYKDSHMRLLAGQVLALDPADPELGRHLSNLDVAISEQFRKAPTESDVFAPL